MIKKNIMFVVAVLILSSFLGCTFPVDLIEFDEPKQALLIYENARLISINELSEKNEILYSPKGNSYYIDEGFGLFYFNKINKGFTVDGVKQKEKLYLKKNTDYMIDTVYRDISKTIYIHVDENGWITERK